MTEIHNQINALFLPFANPRQHIEWNAYNLQRLRDLWADKTLYASNIAALMGTTRSSVLGKVKRLGLEPRLKDTWRARWTPEREALLSQLWEKKITYSEMAEILGNVGRHAVKSKCERMFSKAAVKRRTLAGIKRNRSVAEREKARPEDIKRLCRVELAAFTAPLRCEVVSFEDVVECRWPYGDKAPYLFCDETRFKGSSYCGYHTRLSYGGAV